MQTVTSKSLCSFSRMHSQHSVWYGIIKFFQIRRTYKFLLVLAVLNNAPVYAMQDDAEPNVMQHYDTALMTTFFRLRVWVHKFITQLRHVSKPKLAWGDEQGKIQDEVEKAFTPNYQCLVFKNVFPALAKLSESLATGVAENCEKKPSKLKKGAKLFGAAIKMVIGIGMLHAGAVLDSTQDVVDLLHGGVGVFESLHMVGKTFEFKNEIIKDHEQFQKLRFWKKKKSKFCSMDSILNEKLEKNLNLLESALLGMELKMKANMNGEQKLKDENTKHFNAIMQFQFDLNTAMQKAQLACSYSETNETYQNMFNRMAREQLDDLMFPDCTSPEVATMKRIEQLEKMIRENKSQHDALKFFVSELMDKVEGYNELESDVRVLKVLMNPTTLSSDDTDDLSTR